MASRIGLRFWQSTRAQHQAPFRQAFRSRYQSTQAGPATGQNAFQRLWHSPVGIKTVHFWAPVMKWCLVLAGVSDFARPAESLSLTQNMALTATGAIWTRWCFIIKPRNVFLAAVNFFLGCVGVVQVSRIMLWRQSQAGLTPAESVKSGAREAAEKVEGVVEDTKLAVKKAVK